MIDAMKQALAKFEHLWEIGIDAEYKVELLPEIQALRQAIEEAEKQEPVAWMYKGNFHDFDPSEWASPEFVVTPLYTAPSKREWVGLTDAELAEFSAMKLGAYDLCLEVEAKLKDKNG